MFRCISKYTNHLNVCVPHNYRFTLTSPDIVISLVLIFDVSKLRSDDVPAPLKREHLQKDNKNKKTQ